MKKLTTSILLIIVLVALCAGGFLLFRDMRPPQLAVGPDQEFLPAGVPLRVAAEDLGSGLRHVQVSLVQNGKETPVLDEKFEDTPTTFTREIEIPPKKLADGPFEVVIQARDASLYPFGSAGAATFKRTYTLDTKAPIINVQGNAHNLNQGGSGMVVYRLTEAAAKSGVQVGDYFFPGYPQPDGRYFCLFAMPYQISPAQFNPVLTATDKAGNERKQTFPFHANARNFRHDRINIPDSFLQRKMIQYEDDYPGLSPLEIYIKVNTERRVKDRARLLDIGRQTSPTPLWSGDFLRLPNAAPRAGFGDERDYFHNGDKIDHETHLGMDLASIRNADVPAANAGTVVFADFYGIYGNCVIVDHGMGLQTLYAHLSQFLVAVGDTVTRGQTIAKTGETGLAGGDHLHFGVIVSGVPVNPVEWWDPTWIKNNITSKM